jgi:deoxyribodipyrimidine photolyase-like uncharacterized protein
LPTYVFENLAIARFYNVDPEAVEDWYNVDFLDRLEFMYVQQEIDYRLLKKDQNDSQN